MKRFLETGRIVAVHGLKGEVRVDPWCDSPDFLCEFDVLYFDKGDKEVIIENARPHKNIVIMKIEGVDDADEAAKLRGRILYMDREDVELGEGTYFVQDLIGMDVVDAENGEVYGRITDVKNTGASDIYTVKSDSGEFMIPAVPEFIERTDIEGGRLYIHMIEGLRE
ncbi:MAG: 16S rRNA processing protein RimM [Oscillospiraceae bacterium]|nr:16S rRNA processing protein RimM [Oscillospiraceae bacterium]